MERDLKHLIAQLRAAIDRDDQAQLRALVDKVEQRLDDTTDDDDDLVTELQKAEVRFENEHPTLADAIRRAVDVLSSAGI